jgi:DNA-binding MarR family transcriptional regulator
MNDRDRRAPNPPLAADPIDLARSRWCDEGWTDAADGMAVVTSIMRVQQVLLSRVEAILRPLGLTFARYEVLMLLRFSRSGSLPVGKIGERLQVHPASVTNAVQRLEQDGFVVRSVNPADARSVLAEITSSGYDVTKEATARLNDDVFSSVPISAAEQRQVYSVLKEMRRAFGDFA